MRGGLRTGPLISYMLKKRKLKKYARMYLMSRGIKNYSRTAFDDNVQFWQAGKGVGNITAGIPFSNKVPFFFRAKSWMAAARNFHITLG